MTSSDSSMTNSEVIGTGTAIFIACGLVLFLTLVAKTDAKYRR